MSAIRGFAVIIVIAIIILFFWCFIFGKCGISKGFGTVPPRPMTTSTGGGKRSDEEEDQQGSGPITPAVPPNRRTTGPITAAKPKPQEKLQVSGSGSGGSGVSGTGKGRVQERLQVTGSGNGRSGSGGAGEGSLEVGDPCIGKSGFDWLACKASEGFKNITQGKTIFGQPRVVPGFERIAPTIRVRQAIIVA